MICYDDDMMERDNLMIIPSAEDSILNIMQKGLRISIRTTYELEVCRDAMICLMNDLAMST
ncbi:hypothetical protein GIB67_025237 [Kingdonia uniflora]|uniref:Uncharacterized protein n=1 Tax=Kingdonia uniflora TaxID=39325 RepID=A0A7J7NAZ3_9MAGN|nr:hypothetical protein GIB67_025237 [Kingdonia uniflora]